MAKTLFRTHMQGVIRALSVEVGTWNIFGTQKCTHFRKITYQKERKSEKKRNSFEQVSTFRMGQSAAVEALGSGLAHLLARDIFGISSN